MLFATCEIIYIYDESRGPSIQPRGTEKKFNSLIEEGVSTEPVACDLKSNSLAIHVRALKYRGDIICLV